ncbi:MAG: hypothetical protein KAI47_25525, partial [Deltaproteobacteria bacterium]|nr:hypothetical protein [Deltaproteobacteria bacterium]
FSQLFDAHEVQVLDKAPHDVSHEHDSARENVHEAPAPPTPHEVKDILPPNHARGLALVSGFLAIGVEVLWTRALSLSFPATVYVFAIVVAAYLFGIATGALFLPRLPRGVRPLRLLAILYGIAGVGIIISLFAFPRLASWFYDLVGAGDIATWQGWIAGIAATSLLAMLPATIAMGAALPLLIGLASESRQRSRISGQLYMFNVLGGVFGSLLTTFTLMPSLGLSRTITSLALGYLILALSLTRRARIRPSATLAVVLLLIAGATGVALGVVPEIDPSTSSDPRRTRLYASDDAGASIAIYQFGPKQRVPIRSLKVNNFYGLNVTAPSTIAMQYRLGYLPLALHPNPKRALLVGFATGNTLAAMADVKTVHHLDCVEIYGSLFKLAPYFEAANEDVWRRSKVHLIVEDGRRFMSRPRPRYDVIVGDLYLPRNPGVGSLYSVEYFRATRARLNPGGVFVAWLPLWQLSPTEAGIIIKTFLAVFPKARGLFGNPSRSRPVLGLTGTRVAKAFSPTLRAQETSGASLQHQVEQRVHNALVRIYGAGAARPPARSLRFPPLLSHEILQSWADGKRINTLDNALIEYSAPRTLLRYQLRRITPAGDNLRHIDA